MSAMKKSLYLLNATSSTNQELTRCGQTHGRSAVLQLTRSGNHYVKAIHFYTVYGVIEDISLGTKEVTENIMRVRIIIPVIKQMFN